jgi:hypothetical protein
MYTSTWIPYKRLWKYGLKTRIDTAFSKCAIRNISHCNLVFIYCRCIRFEGGKGYVGCMREIKNAHWVPLGRVGKTTRFGNSRRVRKANIKKHKNVRVCCECVDWIHDNQYRNPWGILTNTVTRDGLFLTSLRAIGFSSRLHGIRKKASISPKRQLWESKLTNWLIKQGNNMIGWKHNAHKANVTVTRTVRYRQIQAVSVTY